VPENWPAGERYSERSFNHPMHSGFAASFHESLGGIRPDSDHPGFSKFILKPCFLPGLEWVKTEYRSPPGKISSHWSRRDDGIEWVFSIPDKSFATVVLPQPRQSEIRLNGEQISGRPFELGAGTWKINMELKTGD